MIINNRHYGNQSRKWVCVCVGEDIRACKGGRARVCGGFSILFILFASYYSVETSLFSIVTHFVMTDRLLENICLHP